jgi:squalene cyclase
MLGGLLDSGQAPDATTEAAARLLPKLQQEDGSWSYTYAREPMQSSDFATTALAARVLYAYAPKDQAERTALALANARRWLVENSPETTDDLAFRLLGLTWLGASPDEVQAAGNGLRAIQRKDGGWAQLESSESSDAYATGLALLALHDGGAMSPRDPVYQRGVAFLLETQKPNGTWQARKWAHAYNRYFDAGFPYGKSQYISIVSTCYAMMALAHAAEPLSKESGAFRLVDPSGAVVPSVAASRSLPAVR